MVERETVTVRMHCPACQTRDVPAQVRTENLMVTLTGWVLARDYYLRCEACGRDVMVVGIQGEELATRTADQLAPHLVGPASSRGMWLAALAIVTFWVPLLGFWLASKAWRANRHSHGLPKLISLSALIVSVPPTLGLVLGAVFIPIFLLIQYFAG